MALAGAAGWLTGAVAAAIAERTSGVVVILAMAVGCAATLAGVYGIFMAAYMTYDSRIGKVRTRERLLDLVQARRPWTGGERILDVGCGRGLMLVGAAPRLTTGTALGIDLWRAEDQTGNTPDATLENARREGVATRVGVQTGDARALPFADASFDVVLSHWVVHNLPDAADRRRAIDEMVRVIRPGGILMLADIANLEAYRTHLTGCELVDLIVDRGGGSRLMGVLSGGTFRPATLIGYRR